MKFSYFYSSITFLFFVSSTMLAQCPYNWTLGQAMQVTGTSPIDAQIPIKSVPGSHISFVIGFQDPDYAFVLPDPDDPSIACANTSGVREVKVYNYKVVFSTDNPNIASFSKDSPLGETVAPVERTRELEIVQNGVIVGQYETMESVKLFISENWQASQGNITVTAVIKDLCQLGIGDIGVVKDPDVTVTWTIEFTDICPESIDRYTQTPQETEWKLGGLLTSYQVKPILPAPGYNNFMITENFEDMKASPFFVKEDLIPKFVKDDKIMDVDQVPSILFRRGKSASFRLNNFGVFDDTHSAKFFDVDPDFKKKIKKAFSKDVLENETTKVGFSMVQRYHCKGPIGPVDPNTNLPEREQVVQKKYEYIATEDEYYFKVKKIHTY